MPPKAVAIARWTGRGSFAGFKSSIESIVRSNGRQARVWATGRSIVVEGGDPLGVAAMLANLPGMSWVAAGFAFTSTKEAGRAAGWLARRYLGRGDRFAVEGEGTGGVVGADVTGAVTSGILEAVKGARVSESPRVRFRAAFDGTKGVTGVEVRKGPGGVSTSRGWANCLVSGGAHSSVVAWFALLAGYRARLLHVRIDDGSVLAVARLYAELCHRVDPRALKLEVLEGGLSARGLAGRARAYRCETFAGFHANGGKPTGEFTRSMTAPLFLMREEDFLTQFESLGVKSFDGRADWGLQASTKFRARKFEGWAEDVSAVLDGLR